MRDKLGGLKIGRYTFFKSWRSMYITKPTWNNRQGKCQKLVWFLNWRPSKIKIEIPIILFSGMPR